MLITKRPITGPRRRRVAARPVAARQAQGFENKPRRGAQWARARAEAEKAIMARGRGFLGDKIAERYRAREGARGDAFKLERPFRARERTKTGENVSEGAQAGAFERVRGRERTKTQARGRGGGEEGAKQGEPPSKTAGTTAAKRDKRGKGGKEGKRGRKRASSSKRGRERAKTQARGRKRAPSSKRAPSIKRPPSSKRAPSIKRPPSSKGYLPSSPTQTLSCQ